MERLEGDGLCFAHAGGMVHALELAAGQTLRIDTGCLVALQPSVSYDIQLVSGIKTALFGGEGLFFATLSGPGRVWLQSLPFSRMADRIYKAIPRAGGGRREEGSILGGIGELLDGDSQADAAGDPCDAHVTREDREEFLKILHAHAQTIEICEACAATTRDLAAEVQRGGLPKRDDLTRTVEEAEKVLADLTAVRDEIRRLIVEFS